MTQPEEHAAVGGKYRDRDQVVSLVKPIVAFNSAI
jgi:hypothetical protein